MTKTLILLRGLPGSGKSTVASLFGDAPHIEADMFFTDEYGNYEFRPENIREAHDWCQKETRDWMRYGSPIVVVSNTFTMEWEMEPYKMFAEEEGYRLVTLIVENRHGSENIHECPPEKVEMMRERFQIKL